MNSYEQMKNSFLLEVSSLFPSFSVDELNKISSALDRSAYGFDVSRKETALSTYVDPIPMLVKTYIIVKKTEGRSDGTLQNYARVLKDFFLWVRKQPEEVNANDIRMYLYNYQQHHHISERTLDKYRETICWFFGWCHAEEYLSRNPARPVKAIKYESKERQALSQMDLEYLRMACKTKRDRAMIEVLYSTGCRVSEFLRLKLSDVHWADNTIHLFGKGKKHRTSYLNAKSIVALLDYLESRNDTCESLFVTERAPFRQMSKEAVELCIRNISERSNIGKRVTPHILRHTTANQAVNSGMPIEDVSKLLGHASVATTMIYAKPSRSKVQTEHIRCIV